jgi:5-methylcytosine-specific restriction endonuclease McrA
MSCFAKISKELISDVERCELCGSKRNLEVHHIIPRCCEIKGIDLDDYDNLIVVCNGCHAKLTPRRMLTKYGIAKLQYNNDISNMKKFYDSLEGCYDMGGIIDLVEEIWFPEKAKMDKERRYRE